MANEQWARQRVAELSPNEEIIHLVKCNHGEHNSGWLVATNWRIWWLTSGGLLSSGETEEHSYGYTISTKNVPLSRIGVLYIGDEMFQMKKAEAEEFARILRGVAVAQQQAAQQQAAQQQAVQQQAVQPAAASGSPVSAYWTVGAWGNCALCKTRNENIPVEGAFCSGCGARIRLMKCGGCGTPTAIATKTPPSGPVGYTCRGCHQTMVIQW